MSDVGDPTWEDAAGQIAYITPGSEIPAQLAAFTYVRQIATAPASDGGENVDWGEEDFHRAYDQDFSWDPVDYEHLGAEGYVGNAGSTTIYRLGEGIERFMITDINNAGASAMAQSDIVVMSDEVSEDVTSYNHVPGGANVLYMDGHVSFLKYPGTKFPITEPSARAFQTIFVNW
jgi:prepilin-type processing-associated H-X9-DG protein